MGIKVTDGDNIRTGGIIVRQRGTRYLAGENVGIGKDHTLFALASGKVSYGDKRKRSFTGKITRFPIVRVR